MGASDLICMPDFVPFKKQATYPHMRPGDVAIWERFIEAFPLAYDRVAYDVAVGEIPDFAAPDAQDVGGEIHKLYQWKIDVLAQEGTHYDVIEVKPNAGASALGQVLCYDVLLEDSLGFDADTRPVLLTDQVRPNMPRLCSRHRVQLLVV